MDLCASHKKNEPSAGLANCKHFSQYILNQREISLRTGNNVVMLQDSSILFVTNFVENPNGAWVIGKRFVQYTDLYTLPLKSSDIGIFMVERLSDFLRKYSISKLKTKYVAIPLEREGSYAVYLLIN